MPDQPAVLVCARADAPLVPEGSIFTHSCCICGHKVMMAPSGQGKLKEQPDILICCGPCFMARQRATDTVNLAGTREEIRQEVKTAKPNLRRHRN